MCRWGTYEDVEVTIAADLSCTGEEHQKLAKIDACIADIVRALSEAGIKTRSSCCGHGKGDGEIMLQDGRTLVVVGLAGGIIGAEGSLPQASSLDVPVNP